MPEFPRKDFRLHVGWRTIKTAVSAMLVAIVYCLIGRNPAFACIGVIFGMGVDMQDSIKNGGNRLFGTLIGGLLSIVVFWIYLLFYPQGGHSVFLRRADTAFFWPCCWALQPLSSSCCASISGRAASSPAAWCSASFCSAPPLRPI